MQEFDAEFLEPDLIKNLYGLVVTRCYGSFRGEKDIDSTSMVPMADSFNHISCDINFQLINTDAHSL